MDEDNEGEGVEGQGEAQEGDEGKGQRGKVDTLKNNDKYDERKAKVERLSVRAVVVASLEGPAPGEKRKADYKALEVWRCNSPAKIAGGVVLAAPAALFEHAREQAQDITQSHTNPTPIGHQTTLYHINPTLHSTN